MDSATLTELRKLQRSRSESSPFASAVDFDAWADKALPLLAFEPRLQNEFKNLVLSMGTCRAFKAHQQETENINSAIGLVNQAVSLLEINPKSNTAGQPAERPSNPEIQQWHQKPLGSTWLTIVGGVLTALAVSVIGKVLGIEF